MFWKSEAKRKNELLNRESKLLKDEISAAYKLKAEITLSTESCRAEYLKIYAKLEEKKIELGRIETEIENSKSWIIQ